MGFNQRAFLKSYLRDHYQDYLATLRHHKKLGEQSVFYKPTKPRGDVQISDLIRNTEFPEGTTRKQKLDFARSVIYCGNGEHPWLDYTTY